jgi:uncharacterized zinc-type alcohol dehydrogenase-like protein
LAPTSSYSQPHHQNPAWQASGAHEVVVSKDDREMQKHQRSFDFILDTVSAEHNLNAYIDLLKPNGTLTLVGAPE